MEFIENIEVIISIICGVISISSVLFCHKAKKDIQISVEKVEKIISNNISVNNGQVAGTINNGLNLKDTKEAAADVSENVFNKKAKNMRRIFFQREEPDKVENGDIWVNSGGIFDFGEDTDES